MYEYDGTAGGRFLYDGVEIAGFGNVGSTGLSTRINTYDEYGQLASTNQGRMQYTGQLRLPDFGAYHYKARAYHPGIGRFMQTDPIGYAAGMNLYGRVGGDPVNFIDPLGLCGQPGEAACPVDDVVTRGRRLPVCDSRCIIDWLEQFSQWVRSREPGISVEAAGRAFIASDGGAYERICAAIGTRPSGENFYGNAGLSLVVLAGFQWGYTANATVQASGALSVNITETGNFAWGLNLFAGASGGFGNLEINHGSTNVPATIRAGIGFGAEGSMGENYLISSSGALFGYGFPFAYSRPFASSAEIIDRGTFTLCLG